MEKIQLNGTYGYKNFIDENTKDFILQWVNDNFDNFKINPSGLGRFNRTILKEDLIFDRVQNIKKRVIELEGFNPETIDLSHRDYIGINLEGAFIHKHMDFNQGDLIHTRWNLILSYPQEGGHSIYNDQINILEENLIWKCVAGKVAHGSTKVIGKKPRITLSLGYML